MLIWGDKSARPTIFTLIPFDTFGGTPFKRGKFQFPQLRSSLIPQLFSTFSPFERKSVFFSLPKNRYFLKGQRG